MKSAPVVLALWLVAISAAVAAEPAGSAGPSAKAPAPKAQTKTQPKAAKAPRGAQAPKDGGSAGQVTLHGDLTCAKCGLHEASKCQSVLVVKEEGRDVKYYLAKNDVAAAEHEKVCGGSVPATVTGTVRDEGGRKVMTAAAVTTNETGGKAAAPAHDHSHE